MTADEHDREAAFTQGVAHYLGARVGGEWACGSPRSPPSATSNWREIVEQTCNDSMQLFVDLQRYNPYTAEMRERLEDALSSVRSQLDTAGASTPAGAGRLGKRFTSAPLLSTFSFPPGPLAQSVEQQPFKLWVDGSNPSRLNLVLNPVRPRAGEVVALPGQLARRRSGPDAADARLSGPKANGLPTTITPPPLPWTEPLPHASHAAEGGP